MHNATFKICVKYKLLSLTSKIYFIKILNQGYNTETRQTDEQRNRNKEKRDRDQK